MPSRKFAELTADSPRTVAELRARIEAGKTTAARRLAEHGADETQPEVSRDVCRALAARIRAA
jgi:hypothetical protein